MSGLLYFFDNAMAKYKKNQNTVSDQSQDAATAIAKGTQKPGQTKEQTKLIAQGIAKGIEQYKKQQKAKAREADKAQKKAAKAKREAEVEEQPVAVESAPKAWLPWGLLLVSWVGFAVYAVVVK